MEGSSGDKKYLQYDFFPVTSYDMCCSLMYTWNDPWSGLENNQTYLGLEAQAGGGLVLISAGVYRHVAGEDTDHDWVFSYGAGIGF